MAGRIIAITGAAGVLGSAVAKAAAELPVQLALIDHAQHCPGPEGAFIQTGVDLTDPVQAGAAIDAVAEQLGGLDVLLNIAGGFRWEPVEGGDPETWPHLFRLNVLTATNASRAAIPHLKRSAAGRIVNVGSAAALKAGLGMGGYAASKSAVHRLTESLSIELGDNDITVNAVLPAIIDTPANRADMPDADFSTWVRPAAIADTILFLASHAARGVNGALVPVSRGHD